LKKNCEKHKGPMSDYEEKLKEYQKIKGKGKRMKNMRRED